MEKSKTGLMAKIRASTFPEGLPTVTARLSVAKNVFSLTSAVYFLCYLSAIGGLAPETTGKAAFLLYPALVLSACLLFIQLAHFASLVYFEKLAFLRVFAIFVSTGFFLLAMASHFSLRP